MLTLTDSNGIMTRSAQFLTRAEASGETFEAIGVPYDTEIQLWDGVRERFAQGSVVLDDGARLYSEHRSVIGLVTDGAHAPEGFRFTGRISDTSLGRDVRALVRDGALRHCSIGFIPEEWTVEERDDVQVITHTKVRAVEFSVVANPAYEDAAIESVRSALITERKTMTTDTLTRSDLTPIEEDLDKMQRSLAALELHVTPSAPAAPEFRSMGDFLQALATGDSTAAEFYRSYTGGTTSDTVMKDSFIGDYIKLVQERRRITNLFSQGTLPSTGLSVDYTQLKGDDTNVARQENEGDELVKGKISLKDENAPVHTLGGWTSLSRQAIERATVPALNTTLRALALRYARATNQLTLKSYRDTVAKLIEKANAQGQDEEKAALEMSASATADDWLDLIVDAALTFEDRGFDLTGLNVSKDVFKKLNRLRDGEHRLMNVWGEGSNVIGELNLPQLSGNLSGIRVNLTPGDSGHVTFYDPLALETLESPGAPAKLQADNILDLTRDFSVYGYVSVVVPFPGALLPVEVV